MHYPHPPPLPSKGEAIRQTAAYSAYSTRKLTVWFAWLTHPKKSRKTLLPCSSLPKQTGATCCERRRDRLKLLKRIMVVAFLVTALGLGACAQHKEVLPPP